MSAGPPPAAQLMQLITGHWVTAAVHTAARLGVADALAAGPRDVEELAPELEAHAPSLFRLLRALASLGVFEEVAPRRFGLTEVGARLRHDHPDVVVAAMETVATIGGPEHVGAILHRAPLLQVASAFRLYETLGRLGGPEAERLGQGSAFPTPESLGTAGYLSPGS